MPAYLEPPATYYPMKGKWRKKRLTQDKDAALVDGDSVCAATVLHGGARLPRVPGYVVALHRAELALAVIATDGVQARV